MFVGRKEELRLLEKLFTGRSSRVAVVYGRRRIGKSVLIRKALESREALFFEGLENKSRKRQLDNFTFQVANQISLLKDRPAVGTWEEALMLLVPALKKNPACIVLDEFQWMANYRTEMVAELKMVWEQYLAPIPGVTLILCGSIASFMTTKVVRSSAFYGRTDIVIHLKPFKLDETRQMIAGKGLD